MEVLRGERLFKGLQSRRKTGRAGVGPQQLENSPGVLPGLLIGEGKVFGDDQVGEIRGQGEFQRLRLDDGDSLTVEPG